MLALLRYILMAFSLLRLYDAAAQRDTVLITINVEKTIALASLQANGHDAVFILDTGSSISIFDEQLAAAYEIRLDRSEADGWIIGLGGKREISWVPGVMLTFNEKVAFRHEFYLADISHLRKILHQRKVTIAGIIGADFFIKNKVIINYRDQHLAMYPQVSNDRVVIHGKP